MANIPSYAIYSAVFLYKADKLGAFGDTERADIVGLVKRFVAALDEAATDHKHTGRRYSALLKNLWSIGNGDNHASNGSVNPEALDIQLQVTSDNFLWASNATDAMNSTFDLPYDPLAPVFNMNPLLPGFLDGYGDYQYQALPTYQVDANC